MHLEYQKKSKMYLKYHSIGSSHTAMQAYTNNIEYQTFSVLDALLL